MRTRIMIAAVAALFTLPAIAQQPSTAGGCEAGHAMMAQAGGCGMGMMGGAGHAMGHGMGMGMGHGMMGGAQGGCAGAGMMGEEAYAGIALDDAQRAKIHEIRKEQRQKAWTLMESAREQRYQLDQEATRRVEAVLTRQQREQLGRASPG